MNSTRKNPIHLADLKAIIINHFFQPIDLQLNRQKELINTTRDVYQTYLTKLQRIENKQDKSKYINETNWLKNELYELLDDEYPEKENHTRDDIFGAFYLKTHDYIEDLPSVISKAQDELRFKSEAQDSFILRLSKGVKNSLFHLSKIPQHSINLFRKQKKPIKRWKHKIPLRALAYHHFQNGFMLEGLSFFEELQLVKCETLNLKWVIDKDLNNVFNNFLATDEVETEILMEQVKLVSEKHRTDELLKKVNGLVLEWKTKSETLIDEFYQNYLYDYDRIGTMELGKNRFSNTKLAQGEKIATKKFQKIYNGWRNTHFAQLDDFQIDLELYQIKYTGLIQYYITTKSVGNRITKTVEEHFGQIRLELDKILKPLQEKTKNKDIIKKLQTERKRIYSKLQKQIIPQTIDSLYNQNIPHLVERLEARILNQVEHMKDNRIIYGKDTYDAPINKSELSHFNPKELILIELFSKFSVAIKELKKEIVRQLGEVEVNLTDITGIVDYNLDAAINSVEENKSDETIHEITLEGIDRTKAKFDGIKEQLNQISLLINEKLSKSLTDLNLGLIQLTINENISDLRIRLAKAKAAEKTQDYKNRILNTVRNFFQISYRFIRQKISHFKNIIKVYAKKIGLLDKPNELSAELSDFLTQTDIAIEKLPYVYRRLYNIKPTEEEVFFVGRDEELKKLHTAYDNWKNGNYSATAITGEKGCGSSSVVNFFVKDLEHENILREKLIINYSSKEDFIEFFQKLLSKKTLNTLEEISDELNKGKYSIIVLEDLQHFYMKRIHGFEAVNLLFELISQTADKVFWLLEFTSYAWNFLEKTIGINRYFKFTVHLQNFTEEQIVKLIMKRHRVSGFSLEFIAPELSKAEKRKMNRLDNQGKDEFLQSLYFKNLNSFAQSNISLALLYWLRSTQKVENNTIFIGHINHLDFNFLNTLPYQSIFTLYAFMLHDSLSIVEHALLFNQSETKSRLDLMVLEDQGILNLVNDRYIINRLLYRQVVNVLTNKNIIH